MATKGRGASVKGKAFERQVRNELRKIYPPERRDRIQRVPMSGASWMKGDVVDLNDPDWSYEAKKQETLALPEWWRQTKSQASSFQIPCMIFSSNHRPIYWVLEKHHWDELVSETPYKHFFEYIESTTRSIYNKLADLDNIKALQIELDGDDVVVLSSNQFLMVRKTIVSNRGE